MAERNLLITIVDTNPIWWGQQSLPGPFAAQTASAKTTSRSNDSLSFNDCMSAIVGFLNTYKAMNQNNAVALIAAHNDKADYLYPSRSRSLDKNASPWDKYDQINDIDEQIQENLKLLTKSQLANLKPDNLANESMITSALGLALCYINRVLKKYIHSDSVKFRILVVKATQDSSNQYMNFMNMIFSAEKLGVIIDSCTLLQDSSLLQQASTLTNGFYFKVSQLAGLLNYLLWLFLPDEHTTRKMLVYPAKTQVDFRAACFCHQKLIDVGYVCSVCLSVFCSFTPICTTCNSNFKFDVNMLKKATMLKNSSFKLKQHQQQQQRSINRTSSNSNLIEGEYGTTRLQDSLASPAGTVITSGDEQTMMSSLDSGDIMDSHQSPYFNQPSVRIITASVPNSAKPTNTRSSNLDDSLEMLE